MEKDDPPVYNECAENDVSVDTPDNGDDASSPTDQEYTTPTKPNAESANKHKHGRVRFNSNANAASHQSAQSTMTFDSSEVTEIEQSTLRRKSLPPSILRSCSFPTVMTEIDVDALKSPQATLAEAAAQARAVQAAVSARKDSWSGSSTASSAETLCGNASSRASADYESIALHQLSQSSKFDGSSEDVNADKVDQHAQQPTRSNSWWTRTKSALKHCTKSTQNPENKDVESQIKASEGFDADGVYAVPPPQRYRSGALSDLLKLHKSKLGHHDNLSTSTLVGSTSQQPDSKSSTPARRKWYEQDRSQETLANLVEASTRLANLNHELDDERSPRRSGKKPAHSRGGSSSRLSAIWRTEETRVADHLADTVARRSFIVKLCRAFMLYGAPTHRLEEYLGTVAQILAIDANFLYLPDCMMISFLDNSTHTSEVQLVRLNQGINLGKLKEVHHIYKEIMHEILPVDEANERLDNLIAGKDQFNRWLRVVVFGMTSVSAATFSFKARLMDLPLIFCFGSLVGFLQLIVAAKSPLYKNVFEVSATVLVSFLARAFGSIYGGKIFCFSALAQGGIVMLLPGYMVLCSSLELQSRAIIPGSLRIVYALVYSLLLAYGITVGAALYGFIDHNATREVTCHEPLGSYYFIFFVPFFVVSISILYQAKWKQMPVMVIIACAGFAVNFLSNIRFPGSLQIASTLGAFTVGVLANLYSRVRHSVAAATLIPAIFTQVPGGLASTGGLLSGIATANMLVNGTGSTETMVTMHGSLDVVYAMGGAMIEIAIGITVGLFMSALIVYPLGKRRSGLFSF